MNTNDKLYYSMLYAIIGDTIGFGNSNIEFNNGFNMKVYSNKDAERISNYTTKHIFDFITSGGYSSFDIKQLMASDDSILTLAVFDAVQKSINKTPDEVIDTIKIKLLEYYLNDELKEKRYYGNRTILSLNRIKNNEDWKKRSFSENAGGCGASIRCMPIGLFYHGEKNRDKLLKISIDSSRITHNNPIGYLGGFASALFTALAVEGVEPKKWIHILIMFFEKEIIHKYVIENITHETKYHLQEINNFHRDIIKYHNWRFHKKGEVYNKKSLDNLSYRNFLFYKKFSDTRIYNPGANGLDSVLIAYDSILASEGNFEKLIYLSMLHAGDSDSTGCIAGALFGAYYGNVNIPKNLTQIELQNQLDNLFNN